MNNNLTLEAIANKQELVEIYDQAKAALKKSCEATTLEDRNKADEETLNLIAKYAERSKALTYEHVNHQEDMDAMKAAILMFYYPVIRVKDTKEKDSKVIIRSIEYAVKPIDLGDLHKVLGGIGANTDWIYTGEKLNFHMTVRAAERVGAKVKSDAFVMNRIAKERALGKNPCSNTQMLKTLNTIIEEMLGDGYKATSHDVNYIFDIYANDNKKSKTSISLANHKTFRQYLKKVCYRILTDATGYEVEQKEIKEKK